MKIRKTKHHKLSPITRLISIAAIGALVFATSANAQEDEEEIKELGEYVIIENLQSAMIVPTDKPVSSTYGFEDEVFNIPRSMAIVTGEQMEIFGIELVEDIRQFSSGIAVVTSFGFQGTPFVRADLSEAYQNGMRRFFQQSAGPTNFNGVENIEIVKGPAPANLGISSYTGGYINYTTKKPYFDKFRGSVGARFGNISSDGRGWDDFSFTLDAGGPFSDELAYRLSFTGQLSDGWHEFSGTDNFALYVALGWRPSNRFRIDFSAEVYYEEWVPVTGLNRPTQDLVDDFTYLSGQPFPILLPTPFGDILGGYILPAALATEVKIEPWRQVSDPDDQDRGTNVTGHLKATYELNDNMTLVNHTYLEWNTYIDVFEYNYIEYVPNDWVFENRFEIQGNWGGKSTYSQETTTGVTFRYNFNESYHRFFAEHWNIFDLTLDPATGRNWDIRRQELGIPFPSFNEFAEVVIPKKPSQTAEAGGADFPNNFNTSEDTLKTIGFFHNHKIELFEENLTIYASARGDYGWGEIENPLPGPVPFVGDASAKDTTLWWTLSGSLVYRPREELSVYFTYQKNHTLVGNVFVGGLIWNPEDGLGGEVWDANSELWEVGLKYAIKDDLLLTFAVYHQERVRQNFLGTAPDNLEVKGFEMDVTYQPGERFWMVANFTYQDATLIDFPDPLVGVILSPLGFGTDIIADDLGFTTFFGVPPGRQNIRHSGIPLYYFNAYFLYAFENGFGIAGGPQWQGGYDFDMVNSIKIGDQLIFNLSLFYEKGPWRFKTDLLNLFNEKTFNSNLQTASYGDLLAVGLPMHARFSVTYSF